MSMIHFLFITFIVAVASGLLYVLYVHSKYENIIIRDVKFGDHINSERSFYHECSSDTFRVIAVCETLMTITFVDSRGVERNCYWSEFIRLVGCKNLCETYNKVYNKFDDIIMRS